MSHTDQTKGEAYIIGLRREMASSLVKIAEENNLSFWSAEGYALEIDKRETIGYAACLEQMIIGFILIRLIHSDEAEILNFATKKNHQRMGIGKRLLEAAIRQITLNHSRTTLWLEVRESNNPAIQFYEKHGFKIAGKRKNFYAHPTETALLMKLEL